MDRFFRNSNLSGGFQLSKDFLFYSTLLIGLNVIVNEGASGLTRRLVRIGRLFPGIEFALQSILTNEVQSAKKLMIADSESGPQTSIEIPIPETGLSHETVLSILEQLKSKETAASEGKSFAYTYTTSPELVSLSKTLTQAYEMFVEGSSLNSEDHEKLLKKAWDLFMHTNALNPMLYPSLRRLETEVVAMTAWMLNGPSSTVGSVTSGGTESILMAVKTYRERAKKLNPRIHSPNMVCAITVHPAFEKAAHYFGVQIIHVPVTADMRMDIKATAKAINSQTILLVGSASQYCHGVIDPLAELSELALARSLPLHVDACFGGFMLPWIERLKREERDSQEPPIPLWDFRLPGVTSMSADIHKYGYSSKGASVVLYRDASLRYYQYFAYAEWPGGLFASPSMAGSRPGGLIAQSWAALVSMGQNGYLRVARIVLDTSRKFRSMLKDVDGVELVTQPDMTALSLRASPARTSPPTPRGPSILAIADVMESIGGWKLERQGFPDSLHMTILPQHAQPGVVEKFISDLKEAIRQVRENPALEKGGTTGVYGMVAMVPDKGIIDDFLLKFFNSLYVADSKSLVEEFTTEK